MKQLGLPELHPFELPPPFLCRSSWPTFCHYPDPGGKQLGFHREGCLDSTRPPCEKAQQLQKWDFEIFASLFEIIFLQEICTFCDWPSGQVLLRSPVSESFIRPPPQHSFHYLSAPELPRRAQFLAPQGPIFDRRAGAQPGRLAKNAAAMTPPLAQSGGPGCKCVDSHRGGHRNSARQACGTTRCA